MVGPSRVLVTGSPEPLEEYSGFAEALGRRLMTETTSPS
jgi:hypothetical protein